MFQRHATDKATLAISAQQHNARGRSRRPSSAGRVSEEGLLQLSSDDIQAMVTQEAEAVARELAGEPSLSLLALADARKEMDDIAMRAQVLSADPDAALLVRRYRCSARMTLRDYFLTYTNGNFCIAVLMSRGDVVVLVQQVFPLVSVVLTR